MCGRTLFGLVLCLSSSAVAALSLPLNPTSNNNGEENWALFMDVTATTPVRITGLTTASKADANAAFSLEIFRRDGTALGGQAGPGSSPDGWTSLGLFPATQGATSNGISVPIDLTAGGLLIAPGETVGLAVKFVDIGPLYFGDWADPYQTFQNADLALVGGESRAIPFDPESLYFASRAIVGELLYEQVSGPDLAVTIGGTPTLVPPGAEVTYDVQVVNQGFDPADDVALDLALPPGATLVSAVPSAGGACIATICTWVGSTVPTTGHSASYIVAMATAGESDVSASASTTSVDYEPANNTAATATMVEDADLSITLTGPTHAMAGSEIVYTITVTNNGPSGARDIAAGIADLQPAASVGTLAAVGAGATSCDTASCLFAGLTLPGESRSVLVIVPLLPDASGPLLATATASAASLELDTSNNEAQAATLISAADLTVLLDADTDPAIAGEMLEYRVTARNDGPASANDLAVVFTPPAGLLIDSADADDGGSCVTDRCTWNGETGIAVERVARFRVAVPSSTTGTLIADVAVESTSFEPDPADNTAPLTLPVAHKGDLQIDKDDGVAWTRPGETLVYVITAANAGPSDMQGVTLADVIPTGLNDAIWSCVQAESTATCPAAPGDAGIGNLLAIVDLPAGTVLRFDVVGTVEAASGETIVNIATVTADGSDTDPDLENNRASDSTFVAPDAIFGDGFEHAGAGLKLPAARKAHEQALQRGR